MTKEELDEFQNLKLEVGSHDAFGILLCAKMLADIAYQLTRIAKAQEKFEHDRIVMPIEDERTKREEK